MTTKPENKDNPKLYAVRLETLLYVIALDEEEAMETAEDNEREEGPRITSIVECNTLKDIDKEWHKSIPFVGRDAEKEINKEMDCSEWIKEVVKWRKIAKRQI